MTSSGQVIELSVEETNKLRSKLGLAPLRGVTSEPGEVASRATDRSSAHDDAPLSSQERNREPRGGSKDDDVVLELSVSETNKLREKLGLAPLCEGNDSSTSQQQDRHAPAPNQGDLQAAADRIEKSKLKREVEQRIEKQFKGSSLAVDSHQDGETEGSSSLLSWAKQMRQQPKQQHDKTKPKGSKPGTSTKQEYTEKDLQGMNVAHSMHEIQGGSSVVLTLADTEILDVHDTSKKVLGLNREESALENVNLAEEQKQRDGLREKRQVELGMGRAGGYAGFDDDEFLELGGTQGPSRAARVDGPKQEMMEGGSKKRQRNKHAVGFQIGALLDEQNELATGSDLFASQSGKAISLESSAPERSTASDFMTTEEDDELNATKKKKKSSKFKKKKKEKKDKEKRKHRRQQSEAYEEDPDDSVPPRTTENSLLADLEQAAQTQGTLVLPRKRRLADDDNDNHDSEQRGTLGEEDGETDKSNRYAAIMEKGNERTRQAFAEKKQRKVEAMDEEEEPDDAFLNAALAKARRLNRLKEMASKKKDLLLGEDAIVEAVQSAPTVSPTQETEEGDGGTKLVFAVDETREFTRALRARQEQSERGTYKGKAATAVVKAEQTDERMDEDVPRIKQEEDEDDLDKDPGMDATEMAQLAEQIKAATDEELADENGAIGGLDGTTGSAVTMGRGLGGVLNILKQTGEITRKNAGREEQRGRAKDERTYEDYEAMDLSQVVQIDERTATAKDKELSKREIKLEYRDKYGRLLTRKDAFRDLSYQFHGYTSGKRKQEKKLQQIAREQAEQRLSSRQASSEGGTLGALKATQQATGKAFIVHKTT